MKGDVCGGEVKVKRYLQLLAVDVKDRWKKVPFYYYYVRERVREKIFGRRFAEYAKYIARCAANCDDEYIAKRVGYYNRIRGEFAVTNPHALGDYRYDCASAYIVDMCLATRGFPAHFRVDGIFGDVGSAPTHPCIVKSRPVGDDNANAILLKLDSARHFNFVRDPIPFDGKKNMAVWRGHSGYKEIRRRLVRDYHAHPLCDVRHIERKNAAAKLAKSYMPLSAQLAYKFIISLEGLDVATNTKWIMSSNSLCFMPKPSCETWFMEGRLKPGFHYVLLADDCADLEEKIRYYAKHDDEAQAIITNANAHVAQFQNTEREMLIAHRVLTKYFQDSRQMPS